MPLTAAEIREIAAEIIAGALWQNPSFYVLILLWTFVSSAATAFFASYFGRRGEALATKADFDQILSQLSATTRASEDIRAEIQTRYGDAATVRQLLRDRLEAITMATFELDLWLEQSRYKAFRGDAPDINGGPFPRIEALQALYFPELANEFLAMQRTFLDESDWLLHVAQEALQEANEGVAGNATANFRAIHAPFVKAMRLFRTRLVELARERAAFFNA